MHPMFGTGDPPSRVHRAPRPSRQPDDSRVDALRGKTRHIDRRLVAVNAACFTALVVLAGIAPGVLAVEVAGRINLGLMLCSALGVLTFCTSIAYDRRLARECDPEAEAIAEAITARQEQQAQQEQRAAAVAADPWGQQRWDAGQGRAAAADAWSQQRWDTGQGRAAAADAWSQQRWDTGQGRAEW